MSSSISVNVFDKTSEETKHETYEVVTIERDSEDFVTAYCADGERVTYFVLSQQLIDMIKNV